MILLSNEQLKDILAGLPAYYPKSLQLDALVRNKLHDRHNLPGAEIVVDEYPEYSVLLYRPVKGFQDNPFPNVLMFCRNADKLEAIIRTDDFVDWTQRLMFTALSKKDVHPIVAKRCAEMGISDLIAEGEDTNALVHILHPSHLVKSDVPDGFRLGELTDANAEQVNNAWHYGTPETLPLIQSLLQNKAPTSAIFTADGTLVAYVMSLYGHMFNGFVVPEYRKKGLYQVVNYDLVSKLVALGQPCAWLYVMRWNTASLNAYRKLGAKIVDPEEFSVEWCLYRPKV